MAKRCSWPWRREIVSWVGDEKDERDGSEGRSTDGRGACCAHAALDHSRLIIPGSAVRPI